MTERPWWQRALASPASPNHGDVPSWNATLGQWVPSVGGVPNTYLASLGKQTLTGGVYGTTTLFEEANATWDQGAWWTTPVGNLLAPGQSAIGFGDFTQNGDSFSAWVATENQAESYGALLITPGVYAVWDIKADLNGIHASFVVPTGQTAPPVLLQNTAGSNLWSLTPTGAVDLLEQAAPAAPAANVGRLFVRDVAGKSQLAVIFPTGAVQVIATEP